MHVFSFSLWPLWRHSSQLSLPEPLVTVVTVFVWCRCLCQGKCLYQVHCKHCKQEHVEILSAAQILNESGSIVGCSRTRSQIRVGTRFPNEHSWMNWLRSRIPKVVPKTRFRTDGYQIHGWPHMIPKEFEENCLHRALPNEIRFPKTQGSSTKALWWVLQARFLRKRWAKEGGLRCKDSTAWETRCFSAVGTSWIVSYISAWIYIPFDSVE